MSAINTKIVICNIALCDLISGINMMAYTAASDANVENISNAACVWYYVTMSITCSGSITFVLLLGYVRYRSLCEQSYVCFSVMKPRVAKSDVFWYRAVYL